MAIANLIQWFVSVVLFHSDFYVSCSYLQGYKDMCIFKQWKEGKTSKFMDEGGYKENEKEGI